MARSASQRFHSSPPLFYIAALLACAAKITTTAITTTLATTAFSGQSGFLLAIIASLFEILALAALLATLALFLRRVARVSMLIACALASLLSCTGAILVLVILPSALNSGNISDTADESHVRQLALAGLVAAAIGLIPQAIFGAMTWPRPAPHCALATHDPCTIGQTPRPRSISLYLGSIGIKSPEAFFGSEKESAAPLSPSCSTFLASRASSRRDSASETSRPTTSKTRLVLQSPFGSRSSTGTQPGNGSAAHPMRSTDEFENWDTSRVNNSFETTYQRQPAIHHLEPIPGSRPVSPAHALAGPFDREAKSEHQPSPDSVLQSPRMTPVATIEREGDSIGAASNFHTRRGSTPSIANPTGPAIEQHIHPLFRTESPVPPPLASPRTVITASPFGGQVLSPELALQTPRLFGSRDGSRAASPAMLSRPSSVKSCRNVPISPIERRREMPTECNFSKLAEMRSQHGSPSSPNG